LAVAVTAKVYGLHARDQYGTTANDRVNWTGDTIQTSLHTVTYVPAQDTDDYFNDATNEITGTGYTAGGVVLGSKTLTYDTATDEARLDAADAQWTTASFTARIAVVWVNTAGASTTDHLMSYVDFGADETVASGTFTIQWASNGVIVLDVT
jgi:hypothetical protein